MEEFDCTIANFTYNGVFGQELKGTTPYKAKFIEWTRDPGIAIMLCSDGKKRLIPSFAVKSETKKSWPEQTYEKGKILFGTPTNSK